MGKGKMDEDGWERRKCEELVEARRLDRLWRAYTG